MLMELITGPQTLSDSVRTSARGDKQGGVCVSELNPRYHEASYRGNTYFAASQSVATTTVGLATTYTGLCLSNPVNSGIVASILMVSIMQSVLQATQPEAYALATGFNATTNVTHTAAVTPQTASVGSGKTPKCLADSSATLPTAPVYTMFLENTASAVQAGPGVAFEIAGAIELNPGAYILWVTPGQASVAGMWFSFLWAELPV